MWGGTIKDANKKGHQPVTTGGFGGFFGEKNLFMEKKKKGAGAGGKGGKKFKSPTKLFCCCGVGTKPNNKGVKKSGGLVGH